MADIEVDEFEAIWNNAIEEFGLEENNWVRDMYEKKELWSNAHITPPPVCTAWARPLHIASWNDGFRDSFGQLPTLRPPRNVLDPRSNPFLHCGIPLMNGPTKPNHLCCRCQPRWVYSLVSTMKNNVTLNYLPLFF
ncbi:hypothetical protein PIB30_028996 [Stylosanthes scabra]|uniref:Uncharacterized protein n=1 Tax=Stylosanthes scabra TaxID=79078 RepID=A0ABU6WC71_9FABA|nr:hypothetical protein [Stylosanthes scabra]